MMTRNYLLFALLIFTNGLFCQEETSKFYLGVQAAPDYAFRTLFENGYYPNVPIENIMEFREDSERGILGYHFGGRFGYNFTSVFGLETGLEFSRNGFATKKEQFTLIGPGNPNDPFFPQDFRFVANYYNLSVPLQSNFTLGKKKLKFITSIGVSCDFLLVSQSVSHVTYKDRKERNVTNDTKQFERFNITPQISSGISYDIKNNLKLRVQPTFRYGVMKIIEAPISGRLWSAGLNFGMFWAI